MTDAGDDKLVRRYRELAREEPPAALDAAILASARRAVQPRPRMRWAAPVSIAAVLVLGIGVALRMQVEQPGIETSMPQSPAPSEYSMPQALEAPAAAQSKDQAAMAEVNPSRAPEKPVPRPKRLEAPAPLADAARPAEPPPPAAELRAAPAPFPASPVPAPAAPATAPAARPVPPPASMTSRTHAPVPPPEALSERRADAQRQQAPMGTTSAKLGAAAPALKREAFTTDSVQQRDQKPADEREAELERIAKLRAEGRHDEADKAIEEFRRRHPDYRIAPAVWERVKPR